MMNSLRLLRVERGGLAACDALLARLVRARRLPQAWERLRHVTETIDFGALDFAWLDWLTQSPTHGRGRRSSRPRS